MRPIITAPRTLVQSKPAVAVRTCELTVVPSKLTTLAAVAFGMVTVRTISIAFTSGLLPPVTWVKSTLTVPSLVMSKDFMMPRLLPPASVPRL